MLELHLTLTVNFSKDLKVQNFDDPRRQTFWFASKSE